jgi:endonuclease/exonuclease/phosphatase (EEP) superfamily protein YafD
MLHLFTAFAWILGLVHALGEGTDAGQTWFLAMTAVVVLPALVLLVVRWLEAGRRHARAAAQQALRDAPASSKPRGRHSGAWNPTP